MKKYTNKQLSLLILLVLSLKMTPIAYSRTEVSNFEELKSAVAAGKKDIYLTADITITSALNYASNTIIDGQNLYSIYYDDTSNTKNDFKIVASGKKISFQNIKTIAPLNTSTHSFSRFANSMTGNFSVDKVSNHRYSDNNKIGNGQNGGGFIEALTGNFYANEVSNNLMENIDHSSAPKGYGGFINSPSGTINIKEAFQNGIILKNDNNNNLAFGGLINSYKTATISIANAHDNFLKTQSDKGYARSLGGVIFHDTATLTLKDSSFYNNQAIATSNANYATAQGGALGFYDDGIIIFDNQSDYTPTYKENKAIATSSTKATALGGAIYNGCDSCTTQKANINSTLTGIFEGNQAIATHTSASSSTLDHLSQGGAIYNLGTISSISGIFKNNIASSSNKATGGAIANDGTITDGIINSKFINNGAIASTLAQGGAIYTSKDLKITADGNIGDGTSTFQGNYIQTNDENKHYQAIYVANSSNTLTFNAINQGTINLYDEVSGQEGYTIALTGDTSSTINIYNRLNNAHLTANNVIVNLTTPDNTLDYNFNSLKLSSNATLNLDNINLLNTTNDGIINLDSTINATNSKITSNITNSSQINLLNSTVDGTIENNGTLNIYNSSQISKLKGTGSTNIFTDLALKDTISSNTINVNNSTLSGIKYLQSDVSLNANNSTISLNNHQATLKQAYFDANSSLSLSINSSSDYGSLSAENITIQEGAKLKATLAQGLITNNQKLTLQLLNASNQDFNNFEDIFDNNMYKFEKLDKNGLYGITLAQTAEDIITNQGGPVWISQVAQNYIDQGNFQDGTIASDIANKLSDLAQNDSSKLITEIKSIAPAEVPIGYNRSIENSTILLKTIDNYLRSQVEPLGLSSGDQYSSISLWAKPYVSNAKINDDAPNSTIEINNQGLIAGIEKKLSSSLKIGTGFQFDEADISAFNRNIESLTTIGFIYSEYKPNNWFINATASYGTSDYDETKYALGSKYFADYDTKFTTLAAITGYQHHNITPELGFRYYHIKQNDYTDSAMQNISENQTDILRAVGGVRFSNSYKTINSDIYLGLTYDLTTDSNDTLVNLTNGSSYIVKGKDLPRLSYEFNVEASTNITENTTIALSYLGAYNNDYQKHTGMLKLKYNF